jgi:hypothetical protein
LKGRKRTEKSIGERKIMHSETKVVVAAIIACFLVTAFAGVFPVSASPATVTVNAANVLKTIPETIYGAHTAAWHEMLFDHGVLRPIAVQRIKEMGLKWLNYPGGGYGNDFVWNDMNLAAEMNTDQFIELCRAVGAEPRITVNLNQPAQLAADWVNYTNIQHDYNVIYWLLHDEPYFYMTAAVYASKVNEFAAAMKAVDPTIKIGVCIQTTSSSRRRYTTTVVQTAGENIDFYNHNYFFVSGTTYTYARRYIYYNYILYNTMPLVKSALAYLRTIVQTYFPTKPVEYQFGSFNSISSYPADWQVNFLPSGLWLAEMLGTLMTDQVDFGGIWCLMNPYPPRQGDYGLLSPEFEGYVDYDAYALVSHHFGDTLVSSTSSNTDVSVYASTSGGGDKLHILLINKHPNGTNIPVTFTLQNFNPQSTATATILDGPTEPAHVYDYGLRTETISDVASTFTWTVPSYSAVVIEIESAGASAGDGGASAAESTYEATSETMGATVSESSTNIALGKPATASSSALDEQSIYYHVKDWNPDKAVDGDSVWTRWAARIFDPHTEWFQLDLQAVRGFNRIVLKWEYWSTNYNIQVSNDTVSWTQIATNTNAIVIKPTPQPIHQFDFSPSIIARYIRLTMTGRPSSYGIAAGCSTWTPQAFSLFEFEVHDTEAPTIVVETPSEGEALQDGITFKALVSDPNLDSVTFSIREPNGEQGKIISPEFESMPPTLSPDGKWELYFDTTLLPDGFYLFLVNAADIAGNTASMVVQFSIRNWAPIELLPASESNKAGRTMPVKFSLRIIATVDPARPFVRNEELTIVIYEKGHPENILQTSTYGTTATDYRIQSVAEFYITNFKTLNTPKTYVVEIYRKGMLIGSFEFKTVK